MKAILVPTDFSATAKNAAQYALQLAKATNCPKLILYHCYSIVNMSDPLMGFEQTQIVEPYREESFAKLAELKNELLPNAGAVNIESYHSIGKMEDGIKELFAQNNADVVVMGITGGGKLKETLVGSNTLNIANNTYLPVIIVPADVSFTELKSILLVSDYKFVLETTPVKIIEKLINNTKAQLHILHIEESTSSFDADEQQGSLQLQQLLQHLHPEFHNIISPDYIQGVNGFITQNNMDLIISIPKKHSFAERIFKESHTKKLAFHTHTPLLVVREQ